METDLHLQISQHQAHLKHENFTVSYHSYPTLLLQNILQLQLHFSCTLYSINNFYGRERIGESNYHDSQGEFWPKLKQCLTDWTKEALPQSFRTRAF